MSMVAPYRDPGLPINERLDDLIQRMTVEEKIGQMFQLEPSSGDVEELLFTHHAGSFAMVRDMALVNRLQRLALEETRLGIPLFFGFDTIHGHAFWPGATVFPTQLAFSCAWDPSLARRVAEVTAVEMRVTGQHQAYSPVLDLPRDLRWGRVDESFGEDPYLIGELGSAMISGYQGALLSNPNSVFATAKHLAGYGDTVGGRDASEGLQTRRAMLSTFLPPFKRAVECGCISFMIAYHAIDGVPCSANQWLLRDLARDGWNFKGFMQTDYDNVGRFVYQLKVAHDITEAIPRAVNAGTDVLNGTPQFLDHGTRLANEGKIEAAALDRACRGVLLVKFLLGLFDDRERCYAHPERVASVLAGPDHRVVALNAARNSIVLLENNGVLPLEKSDIHRLAVVGQNGNDIHNQLGDWSFGQIHGDIVYGEDHPRKNIVTVLDGMRAVGGSDVEVIYEPGCDVLHADLDYYQSTEEWRPYPKSVYDRIPFDRGAVVAACEQADCVVAVVGDSIAQNGENRDRADPSLTPDQLEMLKTIKSLGKKLIIVIVAGKPLAMPWVAENADAVLCAFNPGMEGGRAVAEVLFGETDPSGKLTISWAKDLRQQPVRYDQVPGWHSIGYVDIDAEPQWPFGHGLHYTKFVYSDLRLNPADVQLDEDQLAQPDICGSELAVAVTVTVENTGDRSGTEIVQLYVNDLVSSVTTPVKELKGFTRIELRAGERGDVSLALPIASLSLVTPDLERIVEPGEFQIMVGPSSRDEDLLVSTLGVRLR